MALLPVSVVIDELLAALQSAAQAMLHAPTGAGKSTWLPLEILRRGRLPGRVVMLEPRRLAAKNVTQRLAEQLEVVTEGILTGLLQQDPELGGVSLVILDEFHERSLQADLALALLLDVQHDLRDDLKLLIMSATLDDRRLSQLLPDAPVIRSAGRRYPVERRYQALPAQMRSEDAIASAVQQLLRQQTGSLLLFLPGVGEINRVQGLLVERVAADVDLCPLYDAPPLEAQQRAIRPAPASRRNVVLATNIAETNLTIEGIRLVVDSGLERVAEFDPRSGLNRLVTRRINQASMAQLRLLDWPLRQRLDSQLSSYYTVPTGSHLPLRYQQGEPPVLAVRMQEMFGEQHTPRVAKGRVAVVLKLLSPAHRPPQITRDLAAFWRSAYRELQKEIKGRYPKHASPDDPAQALPTRRTRKYS